MALKKSFTPWPIDSRYRQGYCARHGLLKSQSTPVKTHLLQQGHTHSSKATPPPTRTRLPILLFFLKEFPSKVTKHSNIRACGIHSHSDHHTQGARLLSHLLLIQFYKLLSCLFHLSKEDLMAEAWGSWLQCVHSQEAETVFWSFEIMVNTSPLERMSWKPVLECFHFDFYHTIRVCSLYCLNYVSLMDFYDPGCGLFHKFCWKKSAVCCLVTQC